MLRRWETPQLGASSFREKFFTDHFGHPYLVLALLLFFFAVKKRLKLEVKFKGRIQAAIEYVKTIELLLITA